MKKYLYFVMFLGVFFVTDVFAESDSNADEYRDCAIYTYNQILATTSKDGNIASFTFSDRTQRVEGTNADCNMVEEEEETPETPSGGGYVEDDVNAWIPGAPGETDDPA